MKKIFQSKIFWSVLLILVALRLLIPPLIVPKMNEILADLSPTMSGHIDDLGLSIIRGGYKIYGLRLNLKEKPAEPFFQAKLIDISLAWRDLIKGQITSDVVFDGMQVSLSKDVIQAFKSLSKKDDNTRKNAGRIFPLRIERVDIVDSSLAFGDLLPVAGAERMKLSDIDGRISNLTASTSVPLTILTMNASMFESSDLKVTGQLNQLNRPTAWDMDLELRDFDLAQANPMIQSKVPLTFTSGKLDLYSEVKSENNRISGYFKPFVEKADVVAKRENFDGLKNLGIEVSTAALNLILRDSKDKTLATKVLFAYENGDFKINSAKALSDAIQNGFGEDVPEGIDDEISLSKEQQKADLKGETP